MVGYHALHDSHATRLRDAGCLTAHLSIFSGWRKLTSHPALSSSPTPTLARCGARKRRCAAGTGGRASRCSMAHTLSACSVQVLTALAGAAASRPGRFAPFARRWWWPQHPEEKEQAPRPRYQRQGGAAMRPTRAARLLTRRRSKVPSRSPLGSPSWALASSAA